MLTPVTISKRIRNWVNPKAFVSSLSCTESIRATPETEQFATGTADFDVKIRSLRADLCPDNLIKVLSTTSDVNSAFKIFKWAALRKRFNHTLDTYCWMILEMGLAGNLKEMEGLCQNMARDNFPALENALLPLINSFIGQTRIDEAVRVLANVIVGGYKPTIRVFNLVFSGLVKGKRGFKEMVFVYKEMVKAGVAPTVDTLNCLIEMLFETGRIDSALDQYRRMEKKGCSPDSMTFRIVVEGLIKNDRVDDAIVILNEMLELKFEAKLDFYRAMIPLLCDVNRLKEGIRLFEMMRASAIEPDSSICALLIQCLCRNILLDENVFNLVEKIMASCPTLPSEVLIDVVNGFCELGMIDEVIKLLEDYNVIDTSPYNALLGWCCQNGKFFVAKSLLEKMCVNGIADCGSWNILIRWLCEKAKTQKACELLSRMIVSSWIPNSNTYSALIVGNCRLSKREGALKLFFALKVHRWLLDPVSYSELVEALCNAGWHMEAIGIFSYMSENRCCLQFSSFDVLINGLCERGMSEEAVRLWLLARNSGTCTGSTYVMIALSNMGNQRNLLTYLGQLLVKGINVDAEACCILLQCMIKSNRIRDCTLLFDSMVDKGLVPDSVTLCGLLSYLAGQHHLSSITKSFDELVCHHEVVDSVVYNTMVSGLLKEGNGSEARRYLDLMLENGWVPDAATHALLTGSCNIQETKERTPLTYGNWTTKDEVGDILAEGFSHT